MSRRVIRSGLALIDLEEQSEYIRQHSPSAALRLLTQLRPMLPTTFASMSGNQVSGTRPTIPDPGLRRFLDHRNSRRSIVVLQISFADGIVVIRVLHGAA